MFQTVVLIAIIALFICGQQALAQARLHGRIMGLPKTHAQVIPSTNPPPAKGLYGMGQAFTATSYPTVDTNDDDYWPCIAGNTTGSPAEDADCLSIVTSMGPEPFPPGAVVLGVPQYIWSFADCNGTTNGTNSITYIPCGQLISWFEDDANDLTDDQTELITVTQVQNGATVYIYDSGTQDYGTDAPPNGTGGLTPPANDVISYNDVNFGALGQTGKNNGNCAANDNYPGIGGPSTGYFVIAAGKACVDPVPGLATITATTGLATPAWTCKTAKSVTTCTVKFTKTYSLVQKWTIWLR
jgi:hypothetical protein